MDGFFTAIILGLSLSADALACGFSAGASRMKIPFYSAATAAAVSAAFVAFGMAAGNMSAPFLPAVTQRYISFLVLAVFGLIKLADADSSAPSADCNADKKLSVGEALALGSALSVDGLAAGFGVMASFSVVAGASLCTFVFTALSLYAGAKGGGSMRSGRAGNITAGLALVVLAILKLLG